MDKKVKKIIAFFLIFHLVMPYSVYAAAVGKFVSVVGQVTQVRAGKKYKPVVNSPIEVKDVIITGNNSSAKMVFSDDSSIKLSQNSNMEVKDFFIQGKATRRGIFFMTIGRLVADVTKYIGGKNTFEVHSPTAVCGVRGTGFEFIVGAQLTTTVTCTTGSLSVSALSASGAVVSVATITAGQTAIITASGITVSAAGAAAGAGTAVSTATGTGTVTTTSAAGTTGAAGAAGAAAGTATIAGISAGTVAAGAVVAAGITAAIISASGGSSTTTHTTTSHH